VLAKPQGNSRAGSVTKEESSGCECPARLECHGRIQSKQPHCNPLTQKEDGHDQRPCPCFCPRPSAMLLEKYQLADDHRPCTLPAYKVKSGSAGGKIHAQVMPTGRPHSLSQGGYPFAKDVA